MQSRITKTYMKKPFTYLKSAPQIPVGHIGGGNFTTINQDLLLRLSCMLCPLIVGAAFFVSSCDNSCDVNSNLS